MMRLKVSPQYTLLAAVAALSMAFAAGCIYSPSGVNTSTALYPSPDEEGIVTVTFTPPENNKPQTQVRFQLLPPEEDATVIEKVDDGTGPEYTATFAADGLPEGLNYVDVLYDEPPEEGDDTIVAKLAFVIPETEASPSEDASGSEEASGEEEGGEEAS